MYYKHSGETDGRIVFKLKPAGGSPVDVVDHTGRTRFGRTVEGWNVIKRYGGNEFDDIGVAWDDLKIYDPALVNPDALPDWD